MSLQPEGRPAVAASEYSYEWARRQQLASDAVQGHLGVPIFWELWSPWPSF